MNESASANTPDTAAAAQLFRDNIAITHKLLDQCEPLAAPMAKATDLIYEALASGQRLLCCGNGGSAADAAHFAGEITGRYLLDRPGFPALDLTASPALITALINDFPPEQVFARQVQALGQPGDVLVVFTTSGNSQNIQLALAAAREKQIKTISFLGRDGGKCRDKADVQLIVPADVTARIQEVHQLLYHTICQVLDPKLANLGKHGLGQSNQPV